MSPPLDQTHCGVRALGRNALRLCLAALLAVGVLTVEASVTASAARTQRINKPGVPQRSLRSPSMGVLRFRGKHQLLTAVPPPPATR